MPDLLFLRHAKSDWDADYERDFDRPLNARGEKAADAMGRFLDTQAPMDRVLASPARRVAETLDRIGRRCASLPQPEWVESLYGATQGVVLDLVRALGDAERVMVAGHNPITHMVAAALAGADDSTDWQELQRRYPTGALAEIRFSSWDDVAGGTGRLIRFVKPRDL